MGHQPNLMPDPIQMLILVGIFFACYIVLRTLVFKPYLALLAERHAKTVGLKENAIKAKERAAKLQADYDAFMKTERKKIAAWTEEERKKVSDDERHIIQKARDKVAADLQAQRNALSADAEAARRELAPLVSEYSSQIASKLVGRKVSVSASNATKGQKADTIEVVPT